MNCPTQESLERSALGVSPQPEQEVVQDHLRHCLTCQDTADALVAVSQGLRQAHQLFEQGHADARAQFMSALTARPQPRSPQGIFHRIFTAIYWLGDNPMKRLAWSGVGLTVCAVVFFLVMSFGGRAIAMQEVTARILEAKTYTAKSFVTVPGPEGQAKTIMAKHYWAAPGSIRMESFDGDKLMEEYIYPAGKPGLKVNHAARTFQRLAPVNFDHGGLPPGQWIAALGKYSGDADRELGAKTIDSRSTRGFELAFSKIGPSSAPAGTKLRIWADEVSRLPILVEVVIPGRKEVEKLESIEWDVPLDGKLFEATIPAGYTEVKPLSKPEADEERDIAEAFRIYAEMMGGKYPGVAVIHPLLIRREVEEKTGLAGPFTPEELEQNRDRLQQLEKVGLGFAWVQKRHTTFGAVYHGTTVGPNDKSKVLLRWKQDAGYRVLFGDLHFETVTAEQLKKLEGK